MGGSRASKAGKKPSDSNTNQVRVHRICIYISRSRLTKMVFTIPRMQSEPTDRMLIAITCARGLEDELPAPGGVWEAKSRWPLAVGSLVPGPMLTSREAACDGRHRAWRAGSRETRRLGGLRQAASRGPSGPSEKKQCCAERS